MGVSEIKCKICKLALILAIVKNARPPFGGRAEVSLGGATLLHIAPASVGRGRVPTVHLRRGHSPLTLATGRPISVPNEIWLRFLLLYSGNSAQRCAGRSTTASVLPSRNLRTVTKIMLLRWTHGKEAVRQCYTRRLIVIHDGNDAECVRPFAPDYALFLCSIP